MCGWGTFRTDAELKQHLCGRSPEGNTGAEGDRISFQIRGCLPNRCGTIIGGKVMKKRNKILALLLTAALSMSLAACGKGNADSETAGNAPAETGTEAEADTDTETPDASEEAEAPETQADPFAEAQKNMMDVKSVDATMDMEMDMVVGANGEEQTLESVTTMDMSCIYDPLLMRMDITVDVGEAGSVTTNMYVENTEEGCIMYSNDGTGWKSQEISITAVDEYDFSTDMGAYLNGNYNFQEAGTEEIDGANAYKYTGTITGEEMKQLMLSSGAMNSVGQLGIDTSQVDGMLDDLGDLKVDLWIDEATMYPVKYEIDMTSAMDTLMSSLIDAMGEQGEGLTMSVPKLIMSMTCKNYNAVAEFSVPEEAKAE